MSDPSIRVSVWSSGWIGSIAVRTVLARPGVELVGLWVHSPGKVGKDVGEPCGIRLVGLAATNDAEAIIVLKPDCVLYAASGPERDAGSAGLDLGPTRISRPDTRITARTSSRLLRALTGEGRRMAIPRHTEAGLCA